MYSYCCFSFALSSSAISRRTSSETFMFRRMSINRRLGQLDTGFAIYEFFDHRIGKLNRNPWIAYWNRMPAHRRNIGFGAEVDFRAAVDGHVR